MAFLATPTVKKLPKVDSTGRMNRSGLGPAVDVPSAQTPGVSSSSSTIPSSAGCLSPLTGVGFEFEKIGSEWALTLDFENLTLSALQPLLENSKIYGHAERIVLKNMHLATEDQLIHDLFECVPKMKKLEKLSIVEWRSNDKQKQLFFDRIRKTDLSKIQRLDLKNLEINFHDYKKLLDAIGELKYDESGLKIEGTTYWSGHLEFLCRLTLCDGSNNYDTLGSSSKLQTYRSGVINYDPMAQDHFWTELAQEAREQLYQTEKRDTEIASKQPPGKINLQADGSIAFLRKHTEESSSGEPKKLVFKVSKNVLPDSLWILINFFKDLPFDYVLYFRIQCV